MERETRSPDAQHDRFMRLLPSLASVWREYARGFRHGEELAEFIAECTAYAWSRFLSVVASGRAPERFPWRFGLRVAQAIRRGRRLTRGARAGEPMDRECDNRARPGPARAQVDVRQLADDRADPAEVVCARLDVEAWIATLSAVQARYARLFMLGWTVSEVARLLQRSVVTAWHARAALRESWEVFQRGGK